DEGCFVVLAMLAPPLGVVTWFAVAFVIAHLLRRRPWIKAVFNFGHITSTVGISLLVVHLAGGFGTPATPGGLAAIALGGVAALVTNSVCMATLLAAVGQRSFREALLDGSDLMLVVAIG